MLQMVRLGANLKGGSDHKSSGLEVRLEPHFNSHLWEIIAIWAPHFQITSDLQFGALRLGTPSHSASQIDMLRRAAQEMNPNMDSPSPAHPSSLALYLQLRLLLHAEIFKPQAVREEVTKTFFSKFQCWQLEPPALGDWGTNTALSGHDAETGKDTSQNGKEKEKNNNKKKKNNQKRQKRKMKMIKTREMKKIQQRTQQ